MTLSQVALSSAAHDQPAWSDGCLGTEGCAGHEQSYISSQHQARLGLVGSFSLGFAGLPPSDHSHGLGCMTIFFFIILSNILLFKGNKDAKPKTRV